MLRLYGHAWEWAGWLNYSKSLPAAQKQLSAFNKFTYYFTNEAGGRVVPQGSNEDGFNISPVGLTDIYSGETRSADALDSPSIDLPTSFTDILITNLTVDGILDLQGVTEILGLPQPVTATTLILGLVQLATLAQAQAGTAGPLAITAAIGKAAYMPLNLTTLPTLP